MKQLFPRSLVAAAVVVLLALATGCGGGSASSESSNGGGGQIGGDKAPIKVTETGNEKFVKFGKESSEEEREVAGRILKASLEARAAGDFAGQCATLAQRVVDELAGPSKEEPEAGCAKALKKLAEPLPTSKKIRQNTLDGQIAMLRVKGDRGFALYHGNDGKDHGMLMEREAGQWKVAEILTIEL